MSHLTKFLRALADLFKRGCAHPNPGWPMHNRQSCTACGATRFYLLGEIPGPWQQAVR